MREIQIDYYMHKVSYKGSCWSSATRTRTHSHSANISRTVKRLEINGKYETKKLRFLDCRAIENSGDALHFEFSIMSQIQTIHAAFTAVNVSFFASILCLFQMYCIVACSENGAILIGLKMSVGKNANYKLFPQPTKAKPSKPCRNGKKCHYIYKQVKCMLWLLYYASIAAWYCFNVSVDLSKNSASIWVSALRLLWATVAWFVKRIALQCTLKRIAKLS